MPTRGRARWGVPVGPPRYEPHRPQTQFRRTPFQIGRRNTYEVVAPSFTSNRSLASTFDQLVAEWKKRALTSSSIHEIALSEAYQSMIGLGPAALPLILARVRDDRSPHWFWALRAITRSDPAYGIDTVSEAHQAWLRFLTQEID